jgi:hypothetical protein
LLSAIIFNSCSNNPQNKVVHSPNHESKSSSSSTEESQVSIDGVYSGSQSISGLELVARLTINGGSWSAISQFANESPEIQNGIVRGNDLYDDSGSIKIGYVSGSSASINGYPSMSK